ncbi:MAG: DUF3857 domain-containing protein [Bacteroidia bacterium]|nr:DUF3857 domain-containing protein [Bacteroidia bacterium]
MMIKEIKSKQKRIYTTILSSYLYLKCNKVLFGIFIGIFTIFCTSGFAQSPEIFKQVKLLYPDANAVVLEEKENVNIEIENGELKINSRHHIDKIILNEKAQGYANEYIYYDDTFNEISDIHAVLLTPNGKKYKKQKVDNIKTTGKVSSSIFFHDNKVKQIIFPKINEGSRAIVSYNEETKDPHFLGAFYFSSYMPSVKSEFSISFPKSVKIKYKLLNDDDGKIEFKEVEEKNIKTYTWRSKNVDKYNWDSDAVPISYVEPHVIVYIDEFETEGETKKVLSDANQLYSWYRSLISKVNSEENEELKAIVDTLINEEDSRYDKIKKVFYWVQTNIKYVAFEDGLSGFIPRDASTVCAKRYGDCKDMASIITEMLKYCDIKANFTWIGTRKIPYTYTDIPTPMVDNHMIASVKVDDKYLFLDATGQYTPLGFPTSFIQGKEAMIGLDPENMILEAVPVIEKEKNAYTDSTIVEIQNEALVGRSFSNFTGYSKLAMVPNLSDQTYDKNKDFLSEILEKGHNKFSIDTVSISGVNDRDKKLGLNYDFTIPDYVKNLNNNIYVNLNLDRVYYNDYIQKERLDQDLIIKYKFIEKHKTCLKIPIGYHLTTIPENENFYHNDFGFSIKYTHNDDQIILDKTIYIDALLLDKKDFTEWNKMIDLLNKSYNEVIVLKK